MSLGKAAGLLRAGFCTLMLALVACQSRSRRELARGKQLAQSYCASCHLAPDPSLLDQATWRLGVLPQMGPRLGILGTDSSEYPSERLDPFAPPHYYPDRPLISPSDWKAIQAYYETLAPERLPRPEDSAGALEVSQSFRADSPALRSALPIASFIRIDTQRHQIYVENASVGRLYTFDAHLRCIDSCQSYGALTGMVLPRRAGDTGWICDIGSLLPSNRRSGSLHPLVFSSRGTPRILKEALPLALGRPAGLQWFGHRLVVDQFGHLAGALSLIDPDQRPLRPDTLVDAPGAIQSLVVDANGDGLPDILSLFAQGNEHLELDLNRGNGRFERRILLRFPPVYGSTSFAVADMNGDGYPDIVYTCGDNADFSQVLKPYHGVYVFVNDGHWHFHQAFFYPMDGCYKALVGDFSGSGRPDIAAISFFADYRRHPDESLQLLENEGGLNFRARALPGARAGRWLVMDAGDLDDSGWPVVVAGNFSMGPFFLKGVAHHWDRGPLFVCLRPRKP